MGGGGTFKCSTSHYICSQVSKFRDPLNNITVGCFNAPAPHIVDQCGYSKAFSFIFMSNQLSSIAQASNNSCNSLTEGAINKISSAYSTINDLGNNDRKIGMSSKQMANKQGDNTDPCLTPSLIWKVVENTWVHLIHEKQFGNQFSNSSIKVTGKFLNYHQHQFRGGQTGTAVPLTIPRVNLEFSVNHVRNITFSGQGVSYPLLILHRHREGP